MSNQSGVQTLLSAVHTLLVFVSRPPVQRQFLVFVVGMAVAWGISRALRGKASNRFLAWTQETTSPGIWARIRPCIPIASQIGYPALALVVLYVLIPVLARRGMVVGLLSESALLLWGFLLYRLLVGVLEIVAGEEMIRPYHDRVIAPLFWLLVCGRILDFAVDLDTLSSIQVLVLSGQAVALGTLTTIAIVLYFLFIGAWAAQHLLQRVIIPRTDAEPGLVNAGLTIGRYVVIVIGVSFVLDALGFDTSTITFISGGLSIAIAFGSQQLFANFVSGILLLFEQSLRPGDVVSIGGEMGVVEGLGIRATEIRTLDNTSLVVPNQSILTSAVRNYTKDDPMIRTSLKVAVQGEIDPRELGDLLLSIARQHTAVKARPQPSLLFTSFAGGRTAAELQVWLDSALMIPRVTSELNLMIRDELVKRGLSIA